MISLLIIAAVLAFGIILFFAVFILWGTRWGATPEECAMRMTGDVYLDGGPATSIIMTRAVSISAKAEVVWPWLAQIGRGAGWYSIDRLDNGGKTSAQHIVSWIPGPQPGDATAIGYLRYLEPGRELVWWSYGVHFFRATARLVVDMRITSEGDKTRLVIRNSADTEGLTARLAIWIFAFIDTIMARRQLLQLKTNIERYRNRSANPDRPENGLRDQYQLYEVIYASGEMAGVRGKENALHWRQAALQDGLTLKSGG